MKKTLLTSLLVVAMCISAFSQVFAAEQESFKVAIDLEGNNWFGNSDFSGGYTIVQVGRGSGSRSAVIDRHGNEVQGVRFYSTHPFSEGLAPAFGRPDGGQFGFIDTSANWAVPFVYDAVQPFSEGLAAVGMRGESRQVGAFSFATFNWGFVNRQGNLIIPHQFDEVSAFSNGRAAVAKRDGVSDTLKWGFIDANGNVAIPLIYENSTALVVSEGLIAVSQNGRWGFIDEAGNTIIPFDFSEARPFSMGLAAVRRGTRWGFIDRSGNEVIPFEHQYARSFSGGMAAVASIVTGVGRSYGFINTTGELVIPHMYGLVEDFNYGVASVALRDAYRGFLHGLIDTAGNIVAQIEFDHEIRFSEGLAVAHRGEHFGYIDITGHEVIPFEFFGSGRNFVEGLASVWCLDRGRMFIVLPTETVTATPPPTTTSQPSNWAAPGVARALELGLVTDEVNSSFQSAITRGGFCRLAINFIEILTGLENETIFDNFTESERAAAIFNDTDDPAIRAAAALGIVNGTGDGNFTPDRTLTRQEAATMLRNTVIVLLNGDELEDIPELASIIRRVAWTDESQIASWARDATDAVYALGIMRGVSTTELVFAPQATFTREQAILTFLNLWDWVDTTPISQYWREAVHL